jgi:transposase
MISFAPELRVVIGLNAIDFRCGLNKLAQLAETLGKENPRGALVFVFRNRSKTDVKLIFYHYNGYFLGQKRLSKGKLSWWPRTEAECESLDVEQLLKLLQGVDPRGSFHPDWRVLNLGGTSENPGAFI